MRRSSSLLVVHLSRTLLTFMVALVQILSLPVPIQIELASARGSKVPVLLRCQHRVPDSGRTSIFEA